MAGCPHAGSSTAVMCAAQGGPPCRRQMLLLTAEAREGRSSHARSCRRRCPMAGGPHAGSTAVVRAAQGGPPRHRSLQQPTPSGAQL
jgi:hypothetical protein